MDSRFDAAESYWEKSRRVRETFYRYTLGDLLYNVFEAPEPVLRGYNDQDFEAYLRRFFERFTIDPAWAATLDPDGPLPRDARAQVGTAFATLRAWARDVATLGNAPASWPRMTVELYIPHPAADRDGRPRWMLRGRLADGIVWQGLKLLTEVNRSLIRLCAIAGCARVYVATKNQRYCPQHQAEAKRQTQRRAEGAFRARQKVATTKKKRRTRP